MRGRITTTLGATVLAMSMAVMAPAQGVTACTTTAHPLAGSGDAETLFTDARGVGSNGAVLGVLSGTGGITISWPSSTTAGQLLLGPSGRKLMYPADVNASGTSVGGGWDYRLWVHDADGDVTLVKRGAGKADTELRDITSTGRLGGRAAAGPAIWSSATADPTVLPTPQGLHYTAVAQVQGKAEATGMGWTASDRLVLIKWKHGKVVDTAVAPAGFSPSTLGDAYAGNRVAGTYKGMPAVFSRTTGLTQYVIPGATSGRISVMIGQTVAGQVMIGGESRGFIIDSDGIAHWPAGATYLSAINTGQGGLVVGASSEYPLSLVLWTCAFNAPTQP